MHKLNFKIGSQPSIKLQPPLSSMQLSGSSSQSHRRRSDSEARQSMKTEPDLEIQMEAVEGKPIKMEEGFEGKIKMESQEVITNLTTEHLESQGKLKAEHGLKALRARVSTLEAEKKAADLAMEELRREKSEAYVMVLKADEMLKESEQKSSEKILELEKVIKLVQRQAFLDHQAFMTREKNLRERHAEAEQKLEELHVVVLNLESEKRLMMEESRREKLIVKEESRKRSIKAVEAVEMNMKRLVELKNTLVGELGMTAEDCDKSSNRGLKRKRGVIFGDEIVRALKEDDELCIQAVRQLHKQVLNSECSNTSFYHFEQLWRYEPEVTRPISEIKQRFPHIVGRCRQLAMEYSSYLVAMPCWIRDEDECSSLSVSLVCRRCFMLKDSHDPGACEEGEETNV